MPILKQANGILLYLIFTIECAPRDPLLVCLFVVIMAIV